ncbi:hypothetical protein DERP_013682 [Dermatophagoides pteronyssinus]|uniref:Uncharacterized protein n=1 Tax=Dermatophagoides pteronyssinus TaxID=6956 RepID=A0ABQ8JV58_DERPT|nr:hypothetical protein DERP_013682 [Dermatophagoides pteronyssinus]
MAKGGAMSFNQYSWIFTHYQQIKLAIDEVFFEYFWMLIKEDDLRVALIVYPQQMVSRIFKIIDIPILIVSTKSVSLIIMNEVIILSTRMNLRSYSCV